MMKCTLVHLRDLPNENSVLSEEGIMICALLRFRLRTNILYVSIAGDVGQ